MKVKHLQRKRRFHAAMILVLSALVVPFSHAGDVSPVTLQLKWFHQFQFAGYYAAKAQGFFKDEGLSVQILERNPEKSNIQSVLDGDAHYGVADSGLILERMKGRPVVLLAQIFQHSPLVLITRQVSGIKSPFDLSGKSVMADFAAHSNAPLVAVLNHTLGGIDKVRIMPHSFRLEEFLAGKVDAISAYLTNEPYTLKAQGIPIRIIDPKHYGVDFYGDNLFTTVHEIQTRPDRVEGMIRASIRGWEYAMDHPEEIIALIQNKYNADLDRGRLVYEAQMIKEMIAPDAVPLGTVLASRFDDIVRNYLHSGLISKAQDWSGFIYHQETGATVSNGIDISLSPQEQAWLERHPEFTIAFDGDYAPYSFLNHKGELEGIAVDYAKEIARRTGLKINVFPHSRWNRIYAAGQNRETDVIATLVKRPERTEWFGFTKPYLSLAQYIITRNDQSVIASRSDIGINKIALVKGYSTSKHVIENYPTITPVFVDNLSRALEAVSTGRADATIAAMGMAQHLIAQKGLPNLKFAALYGQGLSEQRFGVRNDWPELASILDKGLESISDKERIKIFQKWSRIEVANMETVKGLPEPLHLADSEKEWLKTHPEIRIGVMDNWPPMNYLDKSGLPTGIGVEYLHAINKRLDGILNIVPAPFKENYEAVKNGRLHALMDITPKPEREVFFSFTTPYLIIPQIIVAQKGTPYLRNEEDLSGRAVALEQGYYTITRFRKNYPGINIREFSSTSECLDAVARGEADAYVGNRAVTLHIIEKELMANLQVMGRTHQPPVELTIGTHKPMVELASILEKALASLSPQEIQDIHRKWIKGDKISETLLDLTPDENNWVQKHPVINVSNEMDWPPVDFVADGRPQGYAIDLVRLLAERIGIRVDFVNGYTWKGLEELFKKGELDILQPAGKSAERSQYAIFSEPIVQYKTYFITRKRHPEITDFQQLSGKKFAVAKGWRMENFLRQNHPDVELFLVDNQEEMLEAVNREDAYATYGNEIVAGYIIQKKWMRDLKFSGWVKDFDNGEINRLHLLGHKDAPELISMMNKALASLTAGEFRQLEEKWISTSEKSHSDFSPQEEAWLKKHPALRLGIDPNWAPLEYFDENGEFSGITSDHIRILKKKLGVSITPVTGLTWVEVQQQARNGKVDIISAIVKSEERSRYLLFTEPYMKLPMVVVMHEDAPFIESLNDLSGTTIAVVKGYITHAYLKQDYPRQRLVLFDSLAQAMKAVASGRAGAVIGNIASINYVKRDLGLNQLKVAATTQYSYDISFGVRKDWPELIPILEKGLYAITDKEKELIKDKWVNIRFKTKTDWRMLGIAILTVMMVAGSIVTVIFIWNRRLTTEVLERKMAMEAVQVERIRAEDALKSLKISEKELRQYADTQAVLVREVNHRVKNNLSAIIGMLHMEQDRAEAEKITSYLPVLQDLIGRIRGLSTVHHLLSESGWRPLEITDLCRQVVNASLQGVPFGKQVHVEISPSQVRVTSNQAHHLTLVVNELATNAMKYALSDRNEANIYIETCLKDQTIEIIFKDDGPGYPDHILRDGFVPSTIGFELIRGITRKSLNGEVTFKNDHGAVARIIFPNDFNHLDQKGDS